MAVTGNAQSKPADARSRTLPDATGQGSRELYRTAESRSEPAYSDDANGCDLPAMDDWQAW